MQDKLKGALSWFDKQLGKLGIPDDETLLMDDFDPYADSPQPILGMPGIQLLDFDLFNDMPFGFGRPVLDHLTDKRERGMMPSREGHRLIMLNLTAEDKPLIGLLRQIMDLSENYDENYYEFLMALTEKAQYEFDKVVVSSKIVDRNGKLDPTLAEVVKRDDPVEHREVVSAMLAAE